jgi:hypothetical protein
MVIKNIFRKVLLLLSIIIYNTQLICSEKKHRRIDNITKQSKTISQTNIKSDQISQQKIEENKNVKKEQKQEIPSDKIKSTTNNKMIALLKNKIESMPLDEKLVLLKEMQDKETIKELLDKAEAHKVVYGSGFFQWLESLRKYPVPKATGNFCGFCYDWTIGIFKPRKKESDWGRSLQKTCAKKIKEIDEEIIPIQISHQISQFKIQDASFMLGKLLLHCYIGTICPPAATFSGAISRILFDTVLTGSCYGLTKESIVTSAATNLFYYGVYAYWPWAKKDKDNNPIIDPNTNERILEYNIFYGRPIKWMTDYLKDKMPNFIKDSVIGSIASWIESSFIFKNTDLPNDCGMLNPTIAPHIILFISKLILSNNKKQPHQQK